jgi:hypothetical protein
MVYVFTYALFTYVCEHVVLVGFVLNVVIRLTLWMLRHRCGYTWKCLITLRSDSTIYRKGLAAA